MANQLKQQEALEGDILSTRRRSDELPDLPLPDIQIPTPMRATVQLTQARVARFLEAVSLGASRGLAASYAGMNKRIMDGWINRIPELQEAVDSAEAVAALRWLRKIEDAIEAGTWQAAAWKLERIYPDIYGRRDIQQIQGPGGGPILVESPAVAQQAKTTVDQWREQRRLNSPQDSSPAETNPDIS